ncbi:hypothetical protein GR253_27890 [Rhizobium leguminosarum]|nr:hypothetical protein [Rhizobium leguminosarum]
MGRTLIHSGGNSQWQVNPSMGVAGGRFVPTPDYDPRFHAFVIDGDYNDLEGKAQLSACSAEFGVLRCEGLAIEDFNETVQEINIIILGMAYPEYETAFASHAPYKA